MNTKEVIEGLRGYEMSTRDSLLSPEEATEIISLLEQGENYKQMYLYQGNLCEELKEEIRVIKKYRQMWEECKENDGSVWGYGKGKYVKEIMEEWEQKYFPREE